MSLAAQTTRKILVLFAACLVIAAVADSAAAQTVVQPPAKGHSIIRGVVTYSDTARPLRNASVVLLNNDGHTNQWTAVTNRRGEFVLENIAAGRYLVFVNAPGILKPQRFERHQSPIIAQLRLNEKRDLFTEVIVNGTDSVNVKVQAVRGGVITGRVVTEDDQPLANAEIKLLKSENGKWLRVDFASIGYGAGKAIRTDASGVYRIAGLTSGDYVVRVSEPIIPADQKPTDDDAYSDGSFMVTFYPSANRIDDAQTISVTEGSESTGIDIRVPERSAHTISGRVSGPENQPGAFIQIRVERTDEIALDDDAYTTNAFADSNGNWRVQGIPAGEYVVTIGGAILVETTSGPAHRTVPAKRINVRVADEDVVVPDTRLTWGAWVNGKITLDGKLPNRAYVLVPQLLPAEDEVVRTGPSRVPTMTTAAYAGATAFVREDGGFFMTAVAPGKYWFEVSTRSERNFYLKSVTRKGVDLMQAPIKLGDNAGLEDVIVSLATDFASIEGEITRPDAAARERSAKQSLRDAVVVLAPATDITRRVAGSLLTSQADAQGKFTFTCPPGEYYLLALAPAQIKKLSGPIDYDYFKNDQQKFTRVKVRSAEKLKGVTLSLAEK